MTDQQPGALIETCDLRKSFQSRVFRRPDATVAAIDGLDLAIMPGEIVGLVGESGCGKTTVARCLLRLEPPTGGKILFEGRSILGLSGASLRAFRRDAQIVFQDPYGSLDPHFTVARSLAEPMRVHAIVRRGERRARAIELLEQVGLGERYLERHRHELSGGEAQRVGIARALVTRPRFLILDEPTSALDASARAQVIALLSELKAAFGMTYLVISHDLSTVRHLCDRMLVMYLGRVVEVGPTEDLFTRPQHPYTEALLSATPVPDPDLPRRAVRLRGELRASTGWHGCALAGRCPHAVDVCRSHQEVLAPAGEGRLVRCHRITEGELELAPILPAASRPRSADVAPAAEHGGAIA